MFSSQRSIQWYKDELLDGAIALSLLLLVGTVQGCEWAPSTVVAATSKALQIPTSRWSTTLYD